METLPRTHTFWPQGHAGVGGAQRPFPSSPIHRPLRVQQLQDGLPIHVRGDVQTRDVQDGGGQVDVEDDVGIPWGGRETRLGHLSRGAQPPSLRRGVAGGMEVARDQGPEGRRLGLDHSLYPSLSAPLCDPAHLNLPSPHLCPTHHRGCDLQASPGLCLAVSSARNALPAPQYPNKDTHL